MMPLFFLASASAVDPYTASAPLPGDIFVAGPKGAKILVDGKETGLVAPATVVGQAPGPHKVQLRDGCRGADVLVEVRSNAIERAEAELAPAVGHISVTVNVFSAELRLDGKPVTLSPNGPLEAACGKHVVEALLPGYRNATNDVEITYDETVAVVLTLVREEFGHIAVGVNPVDASVWVDGKSRGTGPMTVSALPPGTHLVEARRRGYQDATAPISVVDGQTARVDLALLPEAPFWERSGLSRVRWGQVGAATALTAGAGVAGVLAFTSFSDAQAGYAEYAQLTYLDEPERFYDERVQGPTTMGTVWTVLGGVSFLGAGALWVTLRPLPPAGGATIVPVASPSGVGAAGTF